MTVLSRCMPHCPEMKVSKPKHTRVGYTVKEQNQYSRMQCTALTFTADTDKLKGHYDVRRKHSP